MQNKAIFAPVQAIKILHSKILIAQVD